MRIALLWTVLVIGAGVFVAMFAAMWRHRAHPTAASLRGAFIEHLWALVPWLLMALCAAPAVHRILATG
jgi:heme/copper-type cytochrome/quinol oxidase subunit 2